MSSPIPVHHPVLTDTDLCERWLEVLSWGGPGDLRARTLWVALFDAIGAQLPVLMPVDHTPREPDPDLLDGLLRGCAAILADHCGRSGSVALALERPGGASLTPADRAWAEQAQRAATASGVALRRTHVAGPGWVRPVLLGAGAAR